MALPHQVVQVVAARGPELSVQIAGTDADAVGYWKLKRSLISGGPYTTIALSDVGLFLDSDVQLGNTYYYVMSAVNKDGEGPNSAQVSFLLNVVLPAAPVHPFAAHYDGLLVVVGVCYADPAHIHQFRFKRSFTPGGPYKIVWVSADPIFQDSQVSFGRTYYYVVSAVNVNGESPDSAEVSMMPMPEPA